MLEQGEYPSFSEIGDLLAKGIDFEARQDENILADIDENCSIEQFTKELTAFSISSPTKEEEAENYENLENFLLQEEDVNSSGSKSDSMLQLDCDYNFFQNPFLQKSPPMNPFLSNDNHCGSTSSSEHYTIDEIVTKKDEYSQCDLGQPAQYKIIEQPQFNLPQFNLCVPSNEAYMDHFNLYNFINLPAFNVTNGWQYMCSPAPPYATNNRMGTLRPPPGFENHARNGTPNNMH